MTLRVSVAVSTVRVGCACACAYTRSCSCSYSCSCSSYTRRRMWDVWTHATTADAGQVRMQVVDGWEGRTQASSSTSTSTSSGTGRRGRVALGTGSRSLGAHVDRGKGLRRRAARRLHRARWRRTSNTWTYVVVYSKRGRAGTAADM